ncbi:MAG: Crp/Fnr family transcriptional regulator [Planctomycetota bacterium]
MSSQVADWPKHPVFAGIPGNFIDMLARTATEEHFEPKELIFSEGDDADKFFLVTKGLIAIEVFANGRGPVTIQTLGAGEILGWSWLAEPYKWHFDAQATSPTELIAFDAEIVRKALDDHPEFGFAMMKRFVPIIVQRLQATRLQLLDVYNDHN